MARLHPVLTLPIYWSLVRRGRLRVSGEAIVEVKLDGYLAVVVDGRVYTGSGRRAPAWMLNALREAGADYGAASRGRVLFVEVYGSCATPGGYHRSDKLCYRAALVDVGRPPAHASGVEEAALLARTLSHVDRLGLAESYSFESPAHRVVVLEEAPEPWELREMLASYRSYEGYVLKLYAEHGHKLPPDYGVKLRGLLEVKVKHGIRL
ncbi:hypothetical protein [Hyperthermus butylicus]|uniref:Uncharacterized protein n=1 Tax=Hyperthermus butylicus (strain DSM 5456 / JCM 9403 / PLM1-5) TaxID=415426 RepID=A2BMY2_HYPBU|nr:hypothetical protein [Hyperthermus butylicus]ABM81343.1 hypothetical protein Hbut_1521 [Hyperthermus butylicus DSM 5456]